MYGMFPEDTDYDPYTDFSSQVESQSIYDLYRNCILPNISSAVDSVALLLALCLVCNLVSKFIRPVSPRLTRIVYILLGAGALYKFFISNSIVLCKYTVSVKNTLSMFS